MPAPSPMPKPIMRSSAPARARSHSNAIAAPAAAISGAVSMPITKLAAAANPATSPGSMAGRETSVRTTISSNTI